MNCPKCGAEKSNEPFTDYHWVCGSEEFAELGFAQSDKCRQKELSDGKA